MKVVPKVFKEGDCCLEGLINLACGLQLQMLPRLKATASAVSFSVILSCEIFRFWTAAISLICVDGNIEGKANE